MQAAHRTAGAQPGSGAPNRTGLASPEYFAMVMATGIVAAGLRQDGWAQASDALVAIAAAVWVAVVVACVARTARWLAPRLELGAPGKAFAWYAVVAACVVLGSDANALGYRWPAGALAAAALAAWLVVTWLVLGQLGFRQARPGWAAVNGSWYLWPVATQSLAIAAAFGVAGGRLPAGPGGIAGLVAWSSGVVLYLGVTTAVAVRLARAGQGPAGTRAAYWVAMGSAAISVLAATEILALRRSAAVTSVHPALTDVSVLLWSAATCLYLLLAVLTGRWWRRSGHRLRYAPGTVRAWRRPRAARSDGSPTGNGIMRRYKFQAVVAVPAMSGLAALPGPDWHGVIRSGPGSGGSPGLFDALIANWDDESAYPASRAHVATIVAFGPEPADCLPVGAPFALWRGADVGYGVVTRRIFI